MPDAQDNGKIVAGLSGLLAVYRQGIEANKNLALNSAGTGTNVEIPLIAAKTLANVVKDIEKILSEPDNDG